MHIDSDTAFKSHGTVSPPGAPDEGHVQEEEASLRSSPAQSSLEMESNTNTSMSARTAPPPKIDTRPETADKPCPPEPSIEESPVKPPEGFGDSPERLALAAAARALPGYQSPLSEK